MENNEKNNSIFPLVVIFVVIIALIGGAYWFGKSSIMKNSPKEEVSDVREATNSEENAVEEKEPVEEIAVDGSGSAPEEGITEDTEEESNESVIETLKLLFAQKYERKVEDVNVTISKRDGDYLTGGVKFAEELAGGYVLAAKVNDAWKIVFDGNGSWSCSAVDIVDFPSDLVPECWDENTSQMVDRAGR
jgi:hypothetical protein